MRKIGGGGRLVPLIGDTQQLSSISCCKTDKYEEITQNSSKFIIAASKLSSADEICDASTGELLDGEGSYRLLSKSRTKPKMRFKFSIVMRSFRKPSVERT